MTYLCPAPDPSLGIAVRLSNFMACESRALGENGFQALAGGPVGVSLLSGLLTIFVALIGYRFILGHTPDLKDGVNWMVRVGFTLALVTSWPAFQTLVFQVVIDGPNELAGTLLPASGIPADDLQARVQRAYDTLRLGASLPAEPGQGDPAATGAVVQAAMYQSALPQTASLFVLSTSGVVGAFQIAIGFLLAIAPLPIMALLFDATLGIFIGWIRALAGAALAVLSANIVTATHLLALESELAHLQSIRLGSADRVIDPQGLTTIVLIFLLTTLVASLAAIRVASAFRLQTRSPRVSSGIERLHGERPLMSDRLVRSPQNAISVRTQVDEQSRAAIIAGAISSSIRREALTVADSRTTLLSSHADVRDRNISNGSSRIGQGLGTASRRTTSRRTRSSVRRDRTGQ
ncbi:type IV secretion system protein [Caenibius sp. WL]|uniref:type IV secretion system protein n=1 Tax=Caenibius sp. WL TaxID=2872646 RepID=UPI001C99E312|nr:type IV secretion system protein [Caenibius sp. WL]QZP09146.1 type IV secretion system protein [Caenibius sp. WL]